MTCCNECAYPGNPGVCVEGGTCPCHDTEDDPLARVERRLAAIAARYDYGDGEGEALTREAMARLAYRRKRSGKTCDRCREFKPMSAFSRDSSRPDGLRRYCRACASARYRASRVNE
ncbi:hypothetical protein PBI_DRMANHATTAN_70 [Arthrobacter phage DrManhattan]|uniref:Uncharacterized protein n=1 Tax=Arthrobacter phage DrManhattan TaxID=2419955 RepID=A0A3G2KFN0_9CAUD|nr:HNH endonuclease [Arthrobacter phage DrManhattan]AYN57788.1 hypothetical protein PBI_DRMANHATTAN_70 [Arthrobacter phage DrManhattan]